MANPFEVVAKQMGAGSSAIDDALGASNNSVQGAINNLAAREGSQFAANLNQAMNSGFPQGPSGGGAGGIDTVVSAAHRAGFRGNDLATAVAIAMAESGGNASAYNGQGLDRSHGLWQINVHPNANPHYASWNLNDPYQNARAAFELYSSSGFKPWTTYTGHFTGGANQAPYLKYLDQARGAVSRFSNRATPGMTG